ncbi:hypothetical protein BC936DRAFT_148258 [Jimgerdemannia flammicorona]|uniref:Uncharacterized protein n=1 Tax=Jimgerdemannia flammicorona TaxID=994334 RepID=A0A433D3E7_9FUNG|nr:hypothetical protein BC936DRAFT_148258 [Jimgerdemannia flammicorona]
MIYCNPRLCSSNGDDLRMDQHSRLTIYFNNFNHFHGTKSRRSHPSIGRRFQVGLLIRLIQRTSKHINFQRSRHPKGASELLTTSTTSTPFPIKSWRNG